MHSSSPFIMRLEEQLNAIDRDAQALVTGVSEIRGTWRKRAGSWSIAECFEHLSLTNGIYLEAMDSPAQRARQHGMVERGFPRPGVLGRLFVKALEPPVRTLGKAKSPQIIKPDTGVSLATATVQSRRDCGCFRMRHAR